VSRRDYGAPNARSECVFMEHHFLLRFRAEMRNSRANPAFNSIRRLRGNQGEKQ
jgi:hypothetical protein